MTNNGLERTLGLAYMTPLIVLGTYGIVARLSNGTVPTSSAVSGTRIET